MSNLTDKSNIDRLLERALVLRRQGRRHEALAAMRRHFKEARRIPAWAGIIATLHWELDDNRKAAEWFRIATELSPRSDTASLGLFHSLWALGRHRAAKEEMKRFLAVAPSKEYEYLRPAVTGTTMPKPARPPEEVLRVMERRGLRLQADRTRHGRVRLLRWPKLEPAYA